MRNDTHGPEDGSQPPFMSGGNETDVPSVAEDMMDQHDTSPTIEDPAHRPSPSDDTGELDGVAPTVHRSVVEPAPFDYDTYYAGEPAWTPPDAPPAEMEPAAAPRRRNRDGVLMFVGAVAAGVLGAALTIGILAATGTLGEAAVPTTTVGAVSTVTATTPPETITNTVIENGIGAAVNPTAVARKAVPSIVTVGTFTGDGDDSGLGSGSGVVLTSDGFIATNEHVVQGASRWSVTFEDGRIYDAELIGMDELTDLAVLKIDADGLVPIDLGSSDALLLGDPAIAVGNPLGQDGGASISVGIVSAFDRRVDFSDGSRLFGMLQTDAAINQGSSGGALVNAEGALIGITSAIGVSNAGPEGIGYAIPVELVERITDEIIETGDVAHPFIGVTIADFFEEQSDGAVKSVGALIEEITGADSAAGDAGLEEGDIIIDIGGVPITSQNDLILEVRLYRVDDAVEFTALRDGEPVTVTVVMGQRPAEFLG